jgi:hypothetical protein
MTERILSDKDLNIEINPTINKTIENHTSCKYGNDIRKFSSNIKTNNLFLESAFNLGEGTITVEKEVRINNISQPLTIHNGKNITLAQEEDGAIIISTHDQGYVQIAQDKSFSTPENPAEVLNSGKLSIENENNTRKITIISGENITIDLENDFSILIDNIKNLNEEKLVIGHNYTRDLNDIIKFLSINADGLTPNNKNDLEKYQQFDKDIIKLLAEQNNLNSNKLLVDDYLKDHLDDLSDGQFDHYIMSNNMSSPDFDNVEPLGVAETE